MHHNVVGRYGEESLPTLVIGAHYDVCGMDGENLGADDNASGVAGLLELAQLLKQYAPKLPYCIEFVAYANEEPPFFDSEYMGSYVHAKSLRESGREVIGMLCLEMIGYFSDEEGSQKYPLGILEKISPSVGNFIGLVGNFGSGNLLDALSEAMEELSMSYEKLALPFKVPGTDLSDHRNYWHFDYDAVMITDTAFFRNERYHTKYDTPESLNYSVMAKVVSGVYFALLKIKP